MNLKFVNQNRSFMKLNYLKQLFGVLLLFCSSVANAYDFEVDGICYKITSYNNMSVAVTANPNAYFGVLTIPATVNYFNTSYAVTTIENSAFFSCGGITGVTLPNSVTVIEDDAFQNCNALTDITLSERLQTIGNRAFVNCSALENFVIPGSVTSVGDYIFVGCSRLETIVVECETPPVAKSTAFMDVTATLYVPYGTKASYETATGWKNFADIVEMEPEIPEVPVTEVTITVNEYGCGTYCSEYALDFSDVAGLKAYSAIGYKSSTQIVTLARVMTTPAEAGIFVKGEPGEYVVPVIEECNEHTLNLLVGTLEQTTVNSTDGEMSNYKFTVAELDEAPMFYPFEDNTTFSAGKAYLQIPTAWLPATAQKSVSIRFDEGETTGIDELKGQSGEVKTIYDLQGRVVENPTSGIYIIDGKKVLVK